MPPTLALDFARPFVPLFRSVDQGAIAAEFGLIAIVPEPTKLIEVVQLTLVNPTAAAMTYVVTIARLESVEATDAASNRFFDLQRVEQHETRFWRGTDPAFIGSLINQVRVPANDTRQWDVPKELAILDGRTRLCMLIAGGTVNAAITVSAALKEWDLPPGAPLALSLGSA